MGERAPGRDAELHVDDRRRDAPARNLDHTRGDERERVRHRNRDNYLNGSEATALASFGAFRVVSPHDLGLEHGRDAWHGDLRRLDEQGVIERVRLSGGGTSNHVVTLAEQGKNLLEAHVRDGSEGRRQEFYAGFVPDLRTEHETRDGIQKYGDVEPVTEHYSRGPRAGKAKAGQGRVRTVPPLARRSVRTRRHTPRLASLGAAWMTFDERVAALAPLGYTERQTRFLVTVALHGGFCLRRHYAQVAGRQYGQAVRDFMDDLVERGLARRHTFRVDRGSVYHVHASSLYRAIGEADNRNRRDAPPERIARRLMLLHYTLLRHAEWLATEREKVATFTTRFGVPESALPRRVCYGSDAGTTPATRRYFVHKLPIALSPTPPMVSFVCLVTDRRGHVFTEFLADHAALLNHLSSWQLIAVAPRDVNGLPACEAIWQTLMASSRCKRWIDSPTRLGHYMRVSHAIEQHKIERVSVDDIRELHATRRWFGAERLNGLFARWREKGDAILAGSGDVPFLTTPNLEPNGLTTHRLRYRYDRFDVIAEAE